MATDLETLSVVMQVEALLDSLDDMADKLDQIANKIDRVNRKAISVDVHDGELDRLEARLAALQMRDVDVDVDVDRDRTGGGMGLDMMAGLGTIDLDKMIARTIEDMDDAAKQAADSMEDAADGAEDAAEGFFATDIRMTDLHNAAARLVPLLLVIVGALPALYASFIALAAAAAAAAGALAGVTAFAGLGAAFQRGEGDIGAGFEDIISEIRNDFLDAFLPLANRLAPLFEDAMDGLDMLFQSIANRGDILVQFSDMARAFGDTVLRVLPDIIANIGKLADAFAPVFGLLSNLAGEMNIFEALAGFIAEALPTFVAFIRHLAAFLPMLLELSLGFLEVTSLIIAFVNGVLRVLDALGLLNKGMGIVIGAFLTMTTASLILNSALITTARTLVAKMGMAIASVLPRLAMYISSTRAAAFATNVLGVSVAGLIGVLTLGLGLLAAGGAAAVMGDNFLGASDSIDKATSSLENFQSVAGGMDGANPYGIQSDRPDEQALGAGVTNNVDVTVNGGMDETSDKQLKNMNYRLKRSGT
jgi:hypothetical protein